MKNATLIFLLLTIVGCASTKTTSPIGPVCDGVTGLLVSNYESGYDAETVLKFATSLAVAAEADSNQISEIASAEAKIDIQSELAKVIKENVNTSAKVSDSFFEQSVNFSEAACWAMTLIDRDDLTPDQKERALATVDRIINARIVYKDGLAAVKKN
jgi:hypothetical protein